MNSAQTLSIVRNTFREAVRDRVLYNLIAFALIMIASALLFGEISIGIQKTILLNIGLSSISVFGLLIAIFLGIGLVYKEMDQRTLYVLLAKPVRRVEFILGKFCGLGLTLLVNTALMAAGFFLALYYVQGKVSLPDPNLLAALYFVFLALLLATALALFFSCFSSPVLSAALTFALFIGGSLADDLRELGRMVEVPWVKAVGEGVYYVIPNFRNFNIISSVAQGHPVPPALLWQNTAYAALYIGLVLAASALIFQNRNLK